MISFRAGKVTLNRDWAYDTINNMKEKTTFRHFEGRETELKILEEKRIAGGAWGEVYDAEVQLGSRKLRFVIKRFDPGEECKIKDPHEAALASMQTYEKAKKANLKVFTTYRLGEDKKSILMTHAELKDRICIGTNTYKERDNPFSGVVNLEAKGYERLKEIENFEPDPKHPGDSFLEKIFGEAEKAREQGIFLPYESFFFLVDTSENKVDFVIGDLDLVERNLLMAEANADKVRIALADFIDTNVSPESKAKYLRKLNKYFESLPTGYKIAA